MIYHCPKKQKKNALPQHRIFKKSNTLESFDLIIKNHPIIIRVNKYKDYNEIYGKICL